MTKKTKAGCCVDKSCTPDTCMVLPKGTACGDCRHFDGCRVMFGVKKLNIVCDFFPRRFVWSRYDD